VVGTRPVGELDAAGIIRMMVGREITDIYPARDRRPGRVVLHVAGLRRDGILHDLDLEVREGEIVGICGLAGAGRTEFLRAVCGADRVDSGAVQLFGREVKVGSPRQAIRLGIGLLPEDRKTQGLFLNQSVAFNITIAHLKALLRGGLLRLGAERKTAQGYVEQLRVRTPGVGTAVGNLSGGNQQKCVLARNLNARCRILLVDEPTRGVDVGAKREMYQLLADLADRERAAILMVSSELPEILGLSDRVIVMRDGRFTAELSRAEASEERIMQHATVH
jgi:ribose transport system ATP-binding protein